MLDCSLCGADWQSQVMGANEDAPKPCESSGKLHAIGLMYAVLTLECNDQQLHGCRNLFTQPCGSSGKLLATDPTTAALVLPYLRPFKGSQEELVEGAVEGGPAFHAHVDLGLMS